MLLSRERDWREDVQEREDRPGCAFEKIKMLSAEQLVQASLLWTTALRHDALLLGAYSREYSEHE